MNSDIPCSLLENGSLHGSLKKQSTPSQRHRLLLCMSQATSNSNAFPHRSKTCVFLIFFLKMIPSVSFHFALSSNNQEATVIVSQYLIKYGILTLNTVHVSTICNLLAESYRGVHVTHFKKPRTDKILTLKR